MLDIRLIRESPDIMRENLQKRGDEEKIQMLEELIEKDKLWRRSQEKANALVDGANSSGGRDNISVILAQARAKPLRRGLLSRMLGQ